MKSKTIINNPSRGSTSAVRGFTLLEVMAALAIMSVALVVLIRSQTESLNNVHMISNYERGLFITENQLHWTIIDLNEAEAWEDLSTLNGEDGMYLWNVEIQPIEMEREAETRMVMLKIIASTKWPQGRSEGFIQLETWYLWGQEQ